MGLCHLHLVGCFEQTSSIARVSYFLGDVELVSLPLPLSHECFPSRVRLDED